MLPGVPTIVSEFTSVLTNCCLVLPTLVTNVLVNVLTIVLPTVLSLKNKQTKSQPPSRTHHSHVGSVGLGGSDAAVLDDPLVCPPLLAAITAVVAEAPGAVHQHLLGQNLQGTCLEDKWEKVTG